jgi:hypothetical protein
MSSVPTISRRRRRSRNPTTSVIACENLETADMRIFAVLVVLHDAHLDHHGFEDVPRIGIVGGLCDITLLNLNVIVNGRIAIFFPFGVLSRLSAGAFRSTLVPDHILAYPTSVASSDALEGYIDPATRSVAFPGCKLDEVVAPHAGEEDHFSGCVALVQVEVEVNADADDGNQFEEVEC